jgi:hypothetical protein
MGIWAHLERNTLNVVEVKYGSGVVEKNELHTVHRTHLSLMVLETETEGTIVPQLLRFAYVFLICSVLRFIELLLLGSCFIRLVTPSWFGIKHKDSSASN